jgi:hypothetical protein
MATIAATLARARVAVVTGRWPPDLARDVVERLAELAPVAERMEARNVLLRQAAALVSGTRWAKARRLEREIGEATGRVTHADDGVRELVERALELGPAPREVRQLFRILGED